MVLGYTARELAQDIETLQDDLERRNHSYVKREQEYEEKINQNQRDIEKARQGKAPGDERK